MAEHRAGENQEAYQLRGVTQAAGFHPHDARHQSITPEPAASARHQSTNLPRPVLVGFLNQPFSVLLSTY